MPDTGIRMCIECGEIVPASQASQKSVCRKCVGKRALLVHGAPTGRTGVVTCADCGTEVAAVNASTKRSGRPGPLCASCLGQRIIDKSTNWQNPRGKKQEQLN